MSTTTQPDAEQAISGRPNAIDVHSPADGSLVGSVTNQAAGDVARVAGQLRSVQGDWENLGPKARAQHLVNWLGWLLDNERKIVSLVQAEAGKSWGDAWMEMAVAVDVINYFSKNAERFMADRRVRPAGVANASRKLSVRVRPYPLVGLITPWNAPLASPMMDVVGALAAGATVLSKPSEVTPLTWVEAVRGWREEIGAPPVLACVTGDGQTGAAVVEEVDMVMFTGSVRTGREIARRAGERLVPCSLELGGKDAMIVLADADLERAANAAVWGSMTNVGQACVSVERVYVEAPAYDRFVNLVADKVRGLRARVDEPDSYTAEIGTMITSDQVNIVERHVNDAISRGARVIAGGGRGAQGGNYFEPTVLTDVDHSMSCMREETFGPTMPIMKVGSADEAIDLANDSEYGLSSSIWTRDRKKASQLARRIEAGSVSINNVLVATFQLPIPMGGWKQSGLGSRFGGANGMLKYCRQQAVVAERIELKSEPNWYPIRPERSRLIARAVRLLGGHDWRRRLGRPSRSERLPAAQTAI